ncbi:uncharacterized protein LACBIDRAFT_309400 [Laccaria bicolor S238N-H82]|uniref:Predicted protein n=1 Tax=Laccaria bicolor (strain S238N-H82 / ATCC MYA-4686) TaxID=486041 RepID=B0DS80_LACBS|nr:uncharacterized protein LACBIDRAFT_309400 [Laccaria bicolor S238N-H82]EDR02425.1 predicted protein [Laccaria bicolor S238N-H82]|eukprot:XP_001886788.1 predicted protein [Laccaria bicolor S238N-H82]
MVLPQVEAMDVDQDIDSMDVDNPPLNSNSNDEGEQRLLFPGEIVNGKRQVRYMRIHGKGISRSMLQEWCKSFAIPHSGNMKTMRERTIPRARRAHLNARYGAVSKPTKTKKRSTKRAEEMFSRSAMAAPITHLLPMETESGQSKQTACEREQLLSWAKKIVESLVGTIYINEMWQLP